MELNQRLGLDAKTALLTEVGMNINCYINAKVYFKMSCVRVRVRVRAYPPFPTTHVVILNSCMQFNALN